jgi:hypothetical protein
MAVINSPFESQYGFKAPGFSVDSLGNITATSVITNSVVSDSNIADFTVSEVSTSFAFANIVGSNPTITLARSKSYTFKITVPNLTFKIYQADQTTLYDIGLTHSDGSTGSEAQGKTSGTLAVAISNDAPNVLYYGNGIGNVFGTINIIDPAGQFSTLDINATTVATSSSTGALTVAGGTGIAGDLYIGGSLNIDGLGIQNISSPTNLELEAANHIIVKIDGTSLGIIKSTGSTVPVVDTTINNSAIGVVTPSTAAFTSGSVASLPTVETSITNKQYVDSTSLSLAIAFGL